MINCDVSLGAQEADGFRGIKWGSDIKSVKGSMRYIRTDPSYGGIKLYSRKDDELKIGEAILESVEYGFWQDKFCTVVINFQGNSNFSSLKDTTFKKFGSGYQINPFIENYVWDGEIARMMLDYKEILKKGYLFMVALEIYKQQQKYEAEEAPRRHQILFLVNTKDDFEL
jgi:hypothetical protein